MAKKFAVLPDQNAAKYGYTPTRFRIQALRDIPEHGVKAGDLGGFVQSERNLSQTGAAWIADIASATDRSHVGGDSLLSGSAKMTGDSRADGKSRIIEHANLSGCAIVTDNAVVGQFNHASDSAVIRHDAKVLSSSSHIGGNAILEGAIEVRQSLTILDGTYRDQNDLPWSLSQAALADPEYLPRLREAVQIDPAFHRAMATFGAFTDADRLEAVETLFYGNEDSRKALLAISKALGGTFAPQQYMPRAAHETLTRDGIVTAVNLNSYHTNFRHLRVVMDDRDETPGAMLRGVVAVVRPHPEGTGNQTLFQPALVRNLIEENALLTGPRGRVYVLPEVYEDFGDAAVRTLLHQKEIAGQSPLWEPRDPSSKRLRIEVDHLPFLSADRAIGEHRTRVIARKAVSSREAAPAALGYQQLDAYAVVEIDAYPEKVIDLAAVFARSRYHADLYQAVKGSETLYNRPPERVLSELQTQIARNEARLNEAKKQLADEIDPIVTKSLRTEIGSLDPLNQPVLVAIEAIPPMAQVSKPAPNLTAPFTLDGIRRALPPLDWRPLREQGFTNQNVMVAPSANLNVNFVMEADGPENWSLYVEHPKGETVERMIFRADLLSEESAMEMAEDYRAASIARELGLQISPDLKREIAASAGYTQRSDETDMVSDGDNIFAAAFRTRTATGIEHFSGFVTAHPDGRVSSFTYPDPYPSTEEALQEALRRQSQPDPASSRPVIAGGMAPWMLRGLQEQDRLPQITRDLLAICERLDTMSPSPERYKAEMERQDLVQRKYEALGWASPPF